MLFCVTVSDDITTTSSVVRGAEIVSVTSDSIFVSDAITRHRDVSTWHVVEVRRPHQSVTRPGRQRRLAAFEMALLASRLSRTKVAGARQ